jgi:hypothetical protein
MRTLSPPPSRQRTLESEGALSTLAPSGTPPLWPISAAPHHTEPTLAAALFAAWSGDPAVVVASPPGAGKTRLVVYLAEQLNRRAGLTVAIATQTRAQVLDVASRRKSLFVARYRLLVLASLRVWTLRKCPRVTSRTRSRAVRWRVIDRVA